MGEDAHKGEMNHVKMIGMIYSVIGHAMKQMMMFQSMNEISTCVSLIANKLKNINLTCKKLKCRVPIY